MLQRYGWEWLRILETLAGLEVAVEIPDVLDDGRRGGGQRQVHLPRGTRPATSERAFGAFQTTRSRPPHLPDQRRRIQWPSPKQVKVARTVSNASFAFAVNVYWRAVVAEDHCAFPHHPTGDVETFVGGCASAEGEVSSALPELT
eukprot:s4106_g5.t1